MKENNKTSFLVLMTVTVLFAGILIGTFIGRTARLYSVDARVSTKSKETEPVHTLPYQTNQTGKINVNIASAEELTMLPGIGEETAKRIVEYRSKYGIFYALEDMTKVKGVGKSTIEKIRPYATVGG